MGWLDVQCPGCKQKKPVSPRQQVQGLREVRDPALHHGERLMQGEGLQRLAEGARESSLTDMEPKTFLVQCAGSIENAIEEKDLDLAMRWLRAAESLVGPGGLLDGDREAEEKIRGCALASAPRLGPSARMTEGA